MPFEAATELPQRHELIFADRACDSVERVEEGRGVALGEDHAVIVWLAGIIEVVLHLAEEDDGQ